MNQLQVIDIARRLISLLEKPEPGLMTWNVAVGKILGDLSTIQQSGFLIVEKNDG